jgi:Ni/Co efflux regulator RcnB
MRKLILLAAIAAISVPTSGAIAQRYDRQRAEVRQDRNELRRDRNALRRDREVRQVRRTRSAYVAPYRSWNYRPVTIGFRLQPAFYGSRYYISNYSAYRLQAPRNRWQRWIRYGNDLLLVNVRTGRVLDVVHNRYW